MHSISSCSLRFRTIHFCSRSVYTSPSDEFNPVSTFAHERESCRRAIPRDAVYKYWLPSPASRGGEGGFRQVAAAQDENPRGQEEAPFSEKRERLCPPSALVLPISRNRALRGNQPPEGEARFAYIRAFYFYSHDSTLHFGPMERALSPSLFLSLACRVTNCGSSSRR